MSNEDYNTADGSKLCLKCALCCDGSLFMKAHLRPDEQDEAGALGMNVHADDEQFAFYQSCHLLKGNACTVYEDPKRPHICGGFRCKLLKRYIAGEVDMDTALATVQTARNLLADLQRSAPLGNNKRVTINSIRVMMAYLSALPEVDRVPYAEYLASVTQYLRLTTDEFINSREAPKDNMAETEMPLARSIN